MQRQLEDFHQVEVARQDVGFLAKRAHLDAAAAPARAGVFERLTLPSCSSTTASALKIEGKPYPLRMTRNACLRKASGLFARVAIGAGLQQVHLVDDVQQQMRQLVGAVGAVRQQTAKVDVGEIGVGAALGRRDADLGRRGMIVELDEERFQQFAGRLSASGCLPPARVIEG